MATTTPEVTHDLEEDRRLEDAGATPLPDKDGAAPDQSNADASAEAAPRQEADSPPPDELQPAAATDATALPTTANQPPPPVSANDSSFVYNNRDGMNTQQQQLPLSLNKLAIFASSQNKLPVSKVNAIVLRLGRHTEASSQKSGKWYKNDNYVDKDSYTWRNMPLFEDHQRHLWTSEGTVRSSYKK